VKRGDLLRHVRKHGCHLKREGRAHSLWANPATGAVEAVPRHSEISDVLAGKICQAFRYPRLAGAPAEQHRRAARPRAAGRSPCPFGSRWSGRATSARRAEEHGGQRRRAAGQLVASRSGDCKMPDFKIATAQIASVRGDIDGNIAAHAAAMAAAAKQGVSVLVFPELSLTGYEPDLAAELAITAADSRLVPLLALARQHQIEVIVGAPLRNGTAKPALGAILITASGATRTYRKMVTPRVSPSGS